MVYTDIENIDGLLMLIDFEKAFDSILWKFMYNTLEFLGFGENFIHWIQLLNRNFLASILQVGVKSDFFKTERGCKQGDPIAPYLFIICAQILYYLINKNPDIKGRTIGNREFRLTQLADDMTLILDGSQSSLQAALKTVEVFGSFSGLKINKSKTKLVWIGRRKHSKCKLNINSNLEWGVSEFKLLRIWFSVDLVKIPSINYSMTLDNAKKLILNWKKRNLTPFGKITILETFILSKFNHLFGLIPSPSKDFLSKSNTLLYNFILDNKPDKIKSVHLCQDYKIGGLKMTNLECFIQSLKLTWIYRLLKCGASPWVIIFEETVSCVTKYHALGFNGLSTWSVNKKKSILERYVASMIKISRPIKSNIELTSSVLWYNPDISDAPLFYPSWFRNGITFVGDVLNNEGQIMSEAEIDNLYGFKFTNFL